MGIRKQWVALTCQKCGKAFSVEPYREKRARFCGLNCKQSAATIARNIKSRGTGKGYVKVNGRHEHRSVAEQKLGRPLMPGEIVHHKDSNKKNNSPDNLEVIRQPEHVRLHIREMLARRKEAAGY
jgi:hypothetical protein